MTRHASGSRSLFANSVIALVGAAMVVTLILLGNWQLRRLDWKRTLIHAVETRANAAAVAAPRGSVTAKNHEYLRVTLRGRYDHARTRQVKALTEIGAGHWLMTPLITEWKPVWVNRGFIPSGLDPERISRPEAILQVEGLLRTTEPDGTLLERNDPANNRWTSRDVEALSKDVGLLASASYFVDADHNADPASWPRGGLTVLKFRNTHLSYALTWYAMAALLTAALTYVVIRESKLKAQ